MRRRQAWTFVGFTATMVLLTVLLIKLVALLVTA